MQLNFKNSKALHLTTTTTTKKDEKMRHKMKRFQSKKHRLETYKNYKISLSCFNGKRFVLNDILMLTYFHRDLKNHR